MTIIPTAETGEGGQRARRLLAEVLEQRRKVTFVVFGDSERAREIASRADVRAEGHPARQVIWLPDARVLEGRPELAVLERLAREGTEAAFFTLDFALSSIPSAADVTRFSQLELGFANALRGLTA
jgi:hypothetical protein